MRKQRINLGMLMMLTAMFSAPVLADCQGAPPAPAALESEQLTNEEVDALVPAFDAFMLQLSSLRRCITQQSDALKPPPVDAQAVESGEAVIDPQFMVAADALRDAILQVDKLEEITIQRFNFLTENARQNDKPVSQDGISQP